MSMILSYHPVIEGDVNRLCAGREPDEEDRRWFRRARAAILPQGCPESLYRLAVSCCRFVFPDYRTRFRFPGKIGDIRLFRLLGLPHPRSSLFGSVSVCPKSWLQELSYPVVMKSSHGGEGNLVFPVGSFEEALSALEVFSGLEKSGFFGFLVQEFIPTDSRDLRVVVLGEDLISYWRVQKNPENFYHNTAMGAEIDPHRDPELQAMGRDWVRILCKKTGINLAGIDLLFPLSREGSPGKTPLFLEINYYFGRKGLGGSERYYELLRKAVDHWLKSLPGEEFFNTRESSSTPHRRKERHPFFSL